MKKTAVIMTLVLGLTFGFQASAQEIAPIAPEETFVPVAIDPTTAMVAELNDLKQKESDPETGAFTKFVIRLRIRQLENQLNIKKALN